MSERRVVRRTRYSDGTVNVTTTITRPTRDPPSIPGTVAPVLTFPVSQRFLDTINRAAAQVEGNHPLITAAESLMSLRGAAAAGSAEIRMPRRVSIPSSARPKIIYDLKKYENNSEENSEKCPICLAEYEEGEECGVLPCKHAFHDLCLRTWVDENRTCPLCRLRLE